LFNFVFFSGFAVTAWTAKYDLIGVCAESNVFIDLCVWYFW